MSSETKTIAGNLSLVNADLFPEAERLVRLGNKVIIAHCCNDVGAWGSGFVIPLGKRFPEARRVYFELHKNEGLRLGACQFVNSVSFPDKVWIANMIGQHGVTPDEGGKFPVRYGALHDAMMVVAHTARLHGAFICCPKFGCGLAGGEWSKIEQLIRECWVEQGVPVKVYAIDRSFRHAGQPQI
jgi:hypothetical protein